ncbi:hypothetical protein GM921_17325 [Pedobacter sp. LMG 31464]|uniref:histidine kinase n=1 Tax=Pedobacter planticolens TaxID=2679964 RepID=A0A923E1Z5_9SPHI|nr:HAMP domain-containing sensor histidine kinase [Pedobacter planticolens]MBB2147266.1 hypothetical protein [Pedobacter planticolens]
MHLKALSFLLLTFVSITCFAQNDAHYKQLVEKKNACAAILASFTGKAETFDELIKQGNEGLKISKEKDNEFKFIFNSAVATGYYYKQDFKSAKLYFENAYDEAKKANLTEKSLKPLGNLISIYHYLGLQSKADSAANKLKKIAESTDTLKNKGIVYYNLGLYNQQQKFYYSIALDNFLKSAGLQKPIADTTKILKTKLDYGNTLMMVSEIYLQLEQPNKALEYLNEGKPYLNLSKVVDVVAYGKFIRSYVLLNNKQEALKYYNLLHEVAGKTQDKWSELVSSNLELATLFLKEKDFKIAKSYIDKADKQSKLDNAEILTSSVNLAYGDYYKALKDYAQASKYYKLAEHGSSIYSKEQYSDLLKSLTDVEILSGNPEASTYFNKYLIVSDSLNQRKISLNLAEMEAKFQNTFKQQKIGVLNKENEDKNEQLIEEKRTRWFLIGGAFLLCIALLSIYLNFRNKQKANLLLDKKNQELDVLNEQLNGANQTKAKLFSIISHDLRSPVSQLFTFLKLQQQNPDYISEEEKNKHQKKLMQSATSLLSTMEDLLLWSKSQMEHFELDIETIDIQQLFDETKLLMQNQADAKNVEITTENLELKTLQSDENLLVIVLRNLMQNAINHAHSNTQILLNAGLNAEKKSYISIVNQGEVISPEKIEELLNNQNVKSKTSGYGLLIVKELALKINAELNISSTLEKGTEIALIFNKS